MKSQNEGGNHHAAVLRLARYLRVAEKLKTVGIVNIFSNNLGDAIGVTPAIVRKDFSLVGIGGNKRGGYNVDAIIGRLRDVLRKAEPRPVILVGCGRIGGALLEYGEFQKEGLEIVAAFDTDPARQGVLANTPVHPMDDLDRVVKELNVRVGIIAVPDAGALGVFERMIRAGVRGFLNFTSVELKCAGRCGIEECPRPCTVQNVNISLELENLFHLVGLKEGSLTLA